MICASCGAATEAGARFCSQCGSQLPAACATCGQELPAGARFCAACGAAAAGVTREVAQLPQPVAERRVTSVLFGDLVGFTTLSEAHDAEDVREMLSGYFQRCRTIVARYGGTIEKFIGDAVMAVWGVPLSHEDDAERAVRAGLELVDAVAAFGEEIAMSGLRLRVGIVTGEVAVTLGAEGEGMVAGDAVNTAARVQSRAQPGTVWTDRQTRSLAGASVDFVDRGAHELKGKAQPVALYEVVAVMDAVGGTQRTDRVEAALVARRRELGVIKETFHAAAESGRGHVLVVAGEPGVGKSRLGWELQKYLDGLSGRVHWHWGRALAYGDGVAFSPLAAALRGRAQVTDDDGPDVVSAKVTASLKDIVPDPDRRAWLEPRLSVLLTDASDTPFSRDELFAAWLAWFDAIGGDGIPTAWIIDDAQSADDGVLDFVDHVVTASRGALLVVLLARPELLDRRPHLATSGRSTVVHIAGLPPVAMATLLDRLVTGLPPNVIESLIARAEGLPLYAVELVRAMLDSGLIVEDGDGTRTVSRDADATQLAAVDPPTSLRVLITSRLDALSSDERALLGTAAVLGTSFTADGLAALTGTSIVRLEQQLRPLVHRDLLRIVADQLSPEYGQYAFVQNLVRQVAYETQSRRDRAERHLAAIAHLQTLPEAAGQLTAVIADHLASAGSLLPATDVRQVEIRAGAVAWSQKAGNRARSLGAPLDALASYEAALAVATDPAVIAQLHLAVADAAIVAGRYELAVSHAQSVGRDQPVELLARADTAHGQALRRNGDAAGARELLTPWLDRVAELPDAEGSDLARELAFALHTLGDLDAAVPIGELALRLAEDSRDPSLIVRALNVVGIHADIRGLWRNGRALYLEAAALARAQHLTTELGFVLQNLSSLELTRDVLAGIRTAREALDLAQQTGHVNQAIYAAINLIEGLRTVGRWDEAVAVASEPVIGDSIGGGLLDMRQIQLDLGLIAVARGEAPPTFTFRDATDDLAKAALAAAAGGDVASAFELADRDVRAKYEATGLEDEFTVTWTAAVGWGIEAHCFDQARELLRPVADAPAGQVTPVLAAQLRRLRATIEVAASSNVDVEADLTGAIADLEALGARPYRALAQAALAVWLGRQGRAVDAAPLLDEARETFKVLRATAWLAQLDEQLGDPATHAAS